MLKTKILTKFTGLPKDFPDFSSEIMKAPTLDIGFIYEYMSRARC